VNGGHGPSSTSAAPLGVAEREPAITAADEFESPRLDPVWQWPWRTPPSATLARGLLTLQAAGGDAGNAAGTVVARPTLTGDYVATTRLASAALAPGAMAGLAAYGDASNAIGVSVTGDRVIVWQREKGTQSELASRARPAGDALVLRMRASEGRRFQFSVSRDGGAFEPLGTETDGGYLPPWDLAVRVALAVGGPPGAAAQFDWLRIEARPTPQKTP
jgi:beta-xylosidase